MRFKILNFSLFTVACYLLGACSGVKFSQKFDCEKEGTCLVQNGKAVYPAQSLTVAGGKVDILIVNDNSASMSPEQNKMAARFNMFIQNLEAKAIDYRIAFTTTDIATAQNPARGINQNGALQDGRLLSLSTGKKYISKDDGNVATKVAIFNSAIQRPETLQCEQFITQWVNSGKSISESGYNADYLANCPSGDERGIYAAHLTVKNNYDSFIRPEADFHILFLADEDERSQLYLYEQNYSLEAMDSGEGLAQLIKNTFPSKTFGIHPIIVADEYCLPLQSQQIQGVNIRGSYGTEYNLARRKALALMNTERSQKGLPLMTMALGDICAADYTNQLATIFENVATPIVDSFSLKCSNPEGLQVTFTSSDPSVKFEVVDSVVKFNKKLPVGTVVNLTSYSCPE